MAIFRRVSRLRYLSSEKSKCGGSFSGPEGYIESPLYPANYPRKIVCEYTIRVETGHVVLLEFEDFELEYETNDEDGCSYDSVKVSL